jgi:hypothetical protein
VPLSLAISAMSLLLFLMVLMTGELVIYFHGPSSRMWQLHVVLMSEMVVAGAWLVYELRSNRYAQPSLDRPARWFAHHLKRLPLLILAFTACIYAFRYAAFAAHGASYNPLWLPFEAVKISLLYCCWLGLVFGFRSYLEMRQQTENLLNAQRTLAEAKLTQLKGQLRPHFLFNALNTVSATMQVDVARADRLLALVADLLRASLDGSERNIVSLRDELRLLSKYADIMQARFSDRVSLEWSVPDDTLDAAIPSMLLQPLMENAFKHGVERDSTPQQVRVHVSRAGESLSVAIHNTGSTLDEPYDEGFGTRSCRERLQLLYGDAGSFTLAPHADGGVEARIVMPWSTATA